MRRTIFSLLLLGVAAVAARAHEARRGIPLYQAARHGTGPRIAAIRATNAGDVWTPPAVDSLAWMRDHDVDNVLAGRRMR